MKFGTSGLRGPMIPGPEGINDETVARATAGVMQYLTEHNIAGPVVIGYDARHNSHRFAEITAGVAAGSGRDALLLPSALPTPVLVYAARKHHAAVGVMITASHNPARDNGYKVYLRDEAHGVAPLRSEDAPHIEEAIAACDVGKRGSHTQLDSAVLEAYLRDVLDLVSTTDISHHRTLRIAYTPLHGVGGTVFPEAAQRAGFEHVTYVTSQMEPDGDLPSVEYPNPEHPGAMEQLLATAAAAGADIALAHDPDADRLAVAVRHNDEYRVLSGDEIGAVLGVSLLQRGVRGRYATTQVSSPLLSKIAADYSVPYVETSTGFKNLINSADDVAYAYEEALGFAVAPHLVPDKDGITAGLLIASIAAELRAEGRTLWDLYTSLWERYGVHMGTQVLQRFESLTERDTAFAAIPEVQRHVRGERVRITVRASGTEPLIKTYVHMWQ